MSADFLSQNNPTIRSTQDERASKIVDHYDPAKSLTSADALNDWLRCAIDGQLSQIPGIGDANEKHLRNCSTGAINTSYELIGKFMQMKGEGTTCQEHCDRFYNYLKNEAGIHYYLNSIVQAVAMKADLLFPGVYDLASFKV